MKIRNLFEDDYKALPIARVDARAPLEDRVIQLVKNIKQFINANCGPYLKQKAPGKNLYRSIRYDSQPQSNRFYFVRNIRTNRTRDSYSYADNPDDLKNIISDLGFVANRHNSILVGGSREYTEYRDSESTFIIYPMGEFNYTWSELASLPQRTLDDDLTDLPTYTRDEVAKILKKLVKDKNKDVIHLLSKYRADTISDHRKRLKSLRKDKWSSSYDVRYAANELRELEAKSLVDWIGNIGPSDIDARLKNYFPRKKSPKVNKEKFKLHGDDGTFARAMTSGHEIMIHCAKAFCVHYKLHQLVQLEDDELRSTVKSLTDERLKTILK